DVDLGRSAAPGGPPGYRDTRPRAPRQRSGRVEKGFALVEGARRDADVVRETKRGAVAHVYAAGEELGTDGRGVTHLHEDEVGGRRQRGEAELGEPRSE